MANERDPIENPLRTWSTKAKDEVTHPTPEEIAAFCDGLLLEAAAEKVLTHVGTCANCAQEILDIRSMKERQDTADEPAAPALPLRLPRIEGGADPKRQPGYRTPKFLAIAATLAAAVLATAAIVVTRDPGVAGLETAASETRISPQREMKAELIDLGFGEAQRVERSTTHEPNRREFDPEVEKLRLMIGPLPIDARYAFEFVDENKALLFRIDDLEPATESGKIFVEVKTLDIPAGGTLVTVWDQSSETPIRSVYLDRY